MKFNQASKFSLLAVIMVLTLLMTSSFAFAQQQNIDQDHCFALISNEMMSEQNEATIEKVVAGTTPADLIPFTVRCGTLSKDFPITGDTWTPSLEPGHYTVNEENPQGARVSIIPENFEIANRGTSIKCKIQNQWTGDYVLGTIGYDVEFYGTDESESDAVTIASFPDVIPLLASNQEYEISYSFADNTNTPGFYRFHVYRDWISNNGQNYRNVYSDWFECTGAPLADVNVVVSNSFEEDEPDFGTLFIKKIVVGSGPEGLYSVHLCRPVMTDPPTARLSDDIAETGPGFCTDLSIYEGENNFAIAEYELKGPFNVYEDPVDEDQVDYNHLGYRVFQANPDWNYDANNPISGDGIDDSYFTPPTPIFIDPYEDTYIVIVNYFEEDDPQPEYNVIVNKTVKGNKAPDDPSFEVCFTPVEGEAISYPITEAGPNQFILEPGMTYTVTENCNQAPKSVDIDKTEITVPESGFEEINIINDYGNRKKHNNSPGGGGGGTVEEFPTPPPLAEPIIVVTPEPAAPEVIEVPAEPAPELPKTGAPLAAGLGLILAAGGLVISRIKK